MKHLNGNKQKIKFLEEQADNLNTVIRESFLAATEYKNAWRQARSEKKELAEENQRLQQELSQLQALPPLEWSSVGEIAHTAKRGDLLVVKAMEISRLKRVYLETFDGLYGPDTDWLSGDTKAAHISEDAARMLGGQ